MYALQSHLKGTVLVRVLAQQLTALAAKPDDVSLVSGHGHTHSGRQDLTPLCCLSSGIHMNAKECTCTCVQTYAIY